MSQSMPQKPYRSILIRKVPQGWLEVIKREAEKEGMTMSAFIKAYILKPWVMKHMAGDKIED
ncbi:MAG: hypothetical protein QXJ97_09855 [Desulfurococcaceae archaeon]